MNLKDELRKLRDLINDRKSNNDLRTKNIKDDEINKGIYLGDKIDIFIRWYYNIVNYSSTKPNEMRNIIEKMAVWYELRYPDYEINRIMPYTAQEELDINYVMFNSNAYINELFDANADIRVLDWNEFYNARVFINSLPFDEKYLLLKPRYRNLVYIEPGKRKAHFHLTSSGYVEESEKVEEYTKSKVKDSELMGMHIKDVVEYLKKKGIKLPKDNELEETIESFDEWFYQREEMLNCVMYRIIERGGKWVGPRRAFLFAKEFERNIDIPLMYGVDYADPGLRKFIIEYIKTGGSEDLECYINYFSKLVKKRKISTITIRDILETIWDTRSTKFTSEETQLHQRLVNILISQVSPETPREEINLERKK